MLSIEERLKRLSSNLYYAVRGEAICKKSVSEAERKKWTRLEVLAEILMEELS